MNLSFRIRVQQVRENIGNEVELLSGSFVLVLALIESCELDRIEKLLDLSFG